MTVWWAGTGVSEKSAASVSKIRAGPLLTLQTEAPDCSEIVAPVCRCKPEHYDSDVMAEKNNGRCGNYWKFYLKNKDESTTHTHGFGKPNATSPYC